MILKKLSIKSFGKLKNLDVELAPGLNIVYGENESGKSTIQSFIKGIFYGLRKKSKKDEISEYEKYEPWDSSEFAGMIEYETNGKNYRAARNFAVNNVSVYNELWDDITDEFEIDKKNGPLFAENHIGMNEETFERTIFIRQLESRINESQEITDRLLNIQQTGLEETSFRNAIETLEGVIKDKIGSDKTSKKPINLINNEIDRLLKEKYEVNLLRKETAAIEEQIKQKEFEKDAILEKVEQLNNAKQSIKKENLLERYNKAKEYENSLEMTENEILRFQQYENFPVNLEGKLKDILSDIKSLRQILKGKKEYLEGIEAKLKNLGEQSEILGNNQNIFTVMSDFQAMQDAIKEKDEQQQRLNMLHNQLDILNERTKDFKYNGSIEKEDEEQVIELEKRKEKIQDKLDKIGKIKEELEKIDSYTKKSSENSINADSIQITAKDNFLFEEMEQEQVLIKYRALSEYKEKVSLTQLEIEKVKHDIAANDAILFDLSNFNELPENIEEQVMKLYDKASDAASDPRYEIDTLNARGKALKYQLLVNIFLTVISLVLVGYGIFQILYSPAIVPEVIGGVGLIILIIFTIKSIGTLIQIKMLKNEKDEKLQMIPKDKDNNEIEELNKIYQSAGVQDFTSFMRKLYSYNDASRKAKLLNLDLELKLQYLESIKDQLSNIQKEISAVLNLFGVTHDSHSVNDMDILSLKERFGKAGSFGENKDYLNDIEARKLEVLARLKKVTENEDVRLDYAAKVYEELKSEFENVTDKLQMICDKLNINDITELKNDMKDSFEIRKEIDLKKYEIAQLQDIICKLIDKVDNIDHKIKFVLTEYNIEFQEKVLVNETHIESLKEKSNSLLMTAGEVSNLKALKENISSDIKDTEEELKGALNEKDMILDEAMVNNEDEFFEGCTNRIKVRELLDEKSRLLNILDELLKGEDSQSLLKKVASIDGSNVHVREAESLEDVDILIEEHKHEIAKINEDIINLKNDISNKLSGKLEINKIVEQLEYNQARKLDLESSKYSLEIAIDILSETAKQMQQDFAPRLQNEISVIIKQITAGKYSEVRANEKLNLNVLDASAGKIVNIEKLSMGTIEQFYISLRIALSNVLGYKSEKLPIIIDEAFVQYDDLRMLNILEFLLELSKNRQIIIFTCQSREVDAIKRISTEGVKIVELSTI